jgi:FkbM family methyltransferase
MQLDIALLQKQYGLDPRTTTLIHVGASLCQEASYYENFNFKQVIWIEALKEIADKARKEIAQFKNQHIVNALCLAESGRLVSMNVSSNNSESSSVLEPLRHKDVFRDIVFQNSGLNPIESTTLDNVIEITEKTPHYILVLDVQGAELEVLKGALRTMERSLFILCEVSAISLYKNQVLVADLVNFLESVDFKLLMHDISLGRAFGDALFRKVNNSESNELKLLSGRPLTQNYLRLIRIRQSKLIRYYDLVVGKIRQLRTKVN